MSESFTVDNNVVVAKGAVPCLHMKVSSSVRVCIDMNEGACSAAVRMRAHQRK